MMDEKVKRASEFFSIGLYCSQAVFGAFSEEYGLDRQTAFKISSGLNSGIMCADIFGAVSGAVLVVGLKYGTEEDILNKKTEEFIKYFKERNGDVTCRNHLGCDITTPDGNAKAVNENLFKTICMDLVISTAHIVCELEY